jgi:hypothetical protein
LPHDSDLIPAPGPAAQSSVEIGDAELTEYIAAVIERNVVVVIWSYRGNGTFAMPSYLADCSAGKYRLSTLREVKLADGRTVVCSLLVPDAGVRPILEPPSIYAGSDDSNIISLSVSPRVASIRDLAGAIRLAGADGKAGIDVEKIYQEIQQHGR